MQILAKLDAMAIKEKKKSFQVPSISIPKYVSPEYSVQITPSILSPFPLRYPPKQDKKLQPKGEVSDNK